LVAPTGGAARRLPPIRRTSSRLRRAASSPFCRRAGSSTIHSKKPIALSMAIPASRQRLPRSSSEPPEAACRSSSSIQGSRPWYPARSAIVITSPSGSFRPRIVLVFSPKRNGPGSRDAPAGARAGSGTAAWPPDAHAVRPPATTVAPAANTSRRWNRLGTSDEPPGFVDLSPLGWSTAEFHDPRPRAWCLVRPLQQPLKRHCRQFSTSSRTGVPARPPGGILAGGAGSGP
jgi:hypothetical protein